MVCYFQHTMPAALLSIKVTVFCKMFIFRAALSKLHSAADKYPPAGIRRGVCFQKKYTSSDASRLSMVMAVTAVQRRESASYCCRAFFLCRTPSQTNSPATRVSSTPQMIFSIYAPFCHTPYGGSDGKIIP